MELQELINDSELEMTMPQIKAFFLGVLSAEKPMPFTKVIEELLSNAPTASAELKSELQKLWDHLRSHYKQELSNLFEAQSGFSTYLENAKEQLDYFLTALSLSGTNVESCEDDELAEFIDVMEETVMDIEELLANANPSKEEAEELQEILLENWQEYTATKQ